MSPDHLGPGLLEYSKAISVIPKWGLSEIQPTQNYWSVLVLGQISHQPELGYHQSFVDWNLAICQYRGLWAPFEGFIGLGSKDHPKFPIQI